MVIASIAPPEGVSHFYLGLIITAAAPIGYAIEAIISTHAIDVSDPLIVCPLYRMIGGSLIELLCALIVCAATGHVNWITQIYAVIFSEPIILLFLFMSIDVYKRQLLLCLLEYSHKEILARNAGVYRNKRRTAGACT